MMTGIIHRALAGIILALPLAPASGIPDHPGAAPQAPPLADSGGGASSEDTSQSTDGSSTFDNLEIVDDSLKHKLEVMRVGTGRTDGDLLTVFAGVKNLTAHRLTIEFQTIYKDKSDNQLTDGKGSWVPITLKPHEEFEYRSVAISADAYDFLVRIRRAPAGETP